MLPVSVKRDQPLASKIASRMASHMPGTQYVATDLVCVAGGCVAFSGELQAIIHGSGADAVKGPDHMAQIAQKSGITDGLNAAHRKLA